MNQLERLQAKIDAIQRQRDADKAPRVNNCYCKIGQCQRQPGAICRMTGNRQ